TRAIRPGSAATLEGLLHRRDHLGLVVRDRRELGKRRERHVAHRDHHGEAPAALTVDVAREAVAEQDRLPRWRADGAVAGLELRLARRRGVGLDVGERAVFSEDRERVEERLRVRRTGRVLVEGGQSPRRRTAVVVRAGTVEREHGLSRHTGLFEVLYLGLQSLFAA